MTEDFGKAIEFLKSSWVDQFSLIIVLFGFTAGLMHIILLIYARFYKYSITRLLMGNGIFIFFVALCRLMMFTVAENPTSKARKFLVDSCFVLKTVEIWSIGMANTCIAIMSLAYFRLIRLVVAEDLRPYSIERDRAALFFLVLLVLVCTFSTGFCMNYAGRFLINGSYCLAVGSDIRSNELFSLWLAVCICCPALVAIGIYIASATFLAIINYKSRAGGTGANGHSFFRLGTALAHLNNIEDALKYSIISWFITNFLDIFWVVYYPQSSKSNRDGQYYLASAQFATLQNVTDCLVNLHFFILPRWGYQQGLSFFFCCGRDNEL